MVTYQPLNEDQGLYAHPLVEPVFSYAKELLLHRTDAKHEGSMIYINDGVADTRIAAVVEIAKRYRSLVNKVYLSPLRKVKIHIFDFFNHSKTSVFANFRLGSCPHEPKLDFSEWTHISKNIFHMVLSIAMNYCVKRLSTISMKHVV